MPTPNQIVVIKSGMKALGWSDQQYRTCLRNVAGVESCKLLNNTGVEDVLAIMEASGFDTHPSGPTYWQNKVRMRGTFASARMVHKIHAMAGEIRYDLGAMCRRLSGDRTELPEKLHPHEAWNVIEAFKAILDREAQAAAKTKAAEAAQLFQ